jgi:hypothetical protein
MSMITKILILYLSVYYIAMKSSIVMIYLISFVLMCVAYMMKECINILYLHFTAWFDEMLGWVYVV